tara:strand:+ start:653 stop:850 length:198 start_codon:yes stop_codon:yes gene_type:complete
LIGKNTNLKMPAVLKRLQYEALFAVVVLVSIPLFLLWSYWNATVEIFVKVPPIIEEHVRKFIYGE